MRVVFTDWEDAGGFAMVQEQIHYQLPPARRLERKMSSFTPFQA